MKYTIVFVLLLGILVHKGRCFFFDSVGISILIQTTYLESLLEDFTVHCPKEQQLKLKEAISSSEECFVKIDQHKETACTVFTNHFYRCSKEFFDTYETCLPDQSKEIPKFMLQLIEAVFSHLCQENGEHLFELGNSCFWELSNRTTECGESLGKQFEEYQITPPTKNDLCKLLHTARPCIYDHVEESCGNKITRQSFMRAFDVSISVCENGSGNNDVKHPKARRNF